MDVVEKSVVTTIAAEAMPVRCDMLAEMEKLKIIRLSAEICAL